MKQAHRLLLKWARTLHVYFTLFGFALLFFFAATGFMLNHEDWFRPTEPYRTSNEGTMPSKFLGAELDRLGIVESLRKDFAARGEVDSFDEDKEFDGDNEIDRVRVTFKSPGYFAEAKIRRDNGSTTVLHESFGIVGIALDLHRGKTSGEAWAFVIDGVSILFVIISITGLILWSSLKSRAQHGLAVLLLGTAIGFAIYLIYVPR